MKQIGWMIVGNGKFGEILLNEEIEPLDGNLEYWTVRGYTYVPFFIKEEDSEAIEWCCNDTFCIINMKGD